MRIGGYFSPRPDTGYPFPSGPVENLKLVIAIAPKARRGDLGSIVKIKTAASPGALYL